MAVVVFWPSPVSSCIFLLFACLLATTALLELFRLTATLGYPGYPGLTTTITLFLIVAHAAGPAAILISPRTVEPFEIILFVFLLSVGFVRCFSEDDQKCGVLNLLVSAGAFLYLGWTLSFLVRIYFFGPAAENGPYLFLFIVLTTKANDIGGYVFGNLTAKAFGGNHKIMPRLSPGKSWEGLGGSVLFSVGTACLMLALLDERLLVAGAPLFAVSAAVTAGVLIALLGFCGDLSESIIKRAAGAKDAGRIIPGMGGVLDVVDSLILVSPVFYAYLVMIT